MPRPLACCVPRVSVPTACAIPASAVHSQRNHEPVKHGSNLKAILKAEASPRREIDQDVGPRGPQSFLPNKKRGRARYTNTTSSRPPNIMNSNPRSSTSYQWNATGLNVDANSGLPAAQREGPQSFMPSTRKARTRFTNTTRSKPPGITDSNPRK